MPQAKQSKPVKLKTAVTKRVDTLKNKTTGKVAADLLHCPKCDRAYKHQSSLSRHTKDCTGRKDGVEGNGGARPGAGRPPGSESAKTKELKALRMAVQQKIAARADELLAAQFAMATGQHALYKRYKTVSIIGRGKHEKRVERWDVVRCTDQADWLIYLSLPHDEHGNAKSEETGEEFYYQRIAEGNITALTNLFDRAFGKPKESLELGEDPDQPLPQAGTGGTVALRDAFLQLVRDKTKAPEPKGGSKQ